MIKREGLCTTRLGAGAMHMVRRKSGDERWASRIMQGQMPLSSWQAVTKADPREIGLRPYIPCHNLRSAHRKSIATFLAHRNPRATCGGIQHHRALAANLPTMDDKTNLRHCTARTAHILLPCWELHAMVLKPPRRCSVAVWTTWGTVW